MTALPVAHYLRDLNGDLPRGAAGVSRAVTASQT